MKKINLLLLSALLPALLLATNFRSTIFYSKLSEVNRYWFEQRDIKNLHASLPASVTRDEQAMIRLHLQLVEQVLRNRSTTHLSPALKTARTQNLDNLHRYWLAGRFPVNNKLAYRNPVFIDDFDNFCAVGHLIRTSGHEDLSRSIAARMNLAYLADMNDVALDQWATSSGLTKAELAWIQPGYPPTTYIQGFGQGVNGEVNTMYADPLSNDLYIAGHFSTANGSIPANNIVRYIGFNNSWQALGDGLNGTVRKLIGDGNTNFYAAGDFTASGSTPMKGVAHWDGNTWNAMGNINGTVNDIISYKGQLYIGGDFSFSIGTVTRSNLAFWNGTVWMPVCDSINGIVYALAEHKGQLMIGGSFTGINTTAVKHISAFDGLATFSPLGTGADLPVHSIASLGDSVYACGDLTNGTDTFGLASYANGNWNPIAKNLMRDPVRFDQPGLINVRHFSSLGILSESVAPLIDDKSLLVCGDFQVIDGGMGFNSGHNVLIYAPTAAARDRFRGVGIFDSTIHTAAEYRDGIAMGGSFNMVNVGGAPPTQTSWTKRAYHGLAYTDFGTVNAVNNVESWKGKLSVYPNPAAGLLSVESEEGTIHSYSITDMNGREIGQQQTTSGNKISIDRTAFRAPGLYAIILKDKEGRQAKRTVVIE